MASPAWLQAPNPVQRTVIRPVLRAVMAVSIVSASLTAAVVPSLAVAQDAGDSLAASVPASSLVYADINLDQESDQWITAGELVDRSGVLSLAEPGTEDEIDGALDQLSSVLDGEAAFVLTTLPTNVDVMSVSSDITGAAQDPAAAAQGEVPDGWAALFQPSDPQALYDQIVSSSSGTPEETDYNGYTITLFPAEDETGTPQAVALVDDVVVVATSVESIQPVIDAKTGDVDTLADDQTYSDIRDQLNAGTLASGYVGGENLLAAVEEDMPELLTGVQPAELAMINANTGFAFWADDPGFRLDTIATPGENGTIEARAAIEGNVAENVEDVSLFYVGGTDLGADPNLNAAALLFAQELVGVPAGSTPTASQDPEAYADEIFNQAESTLGFNLKTDLLDNLNGDWGMAGSAGGLSSGQLDISFVFASGSDDPETLQSVSDQISELIQSSPDSPELDSRDVNGSTLTTVDLSADSGLPIVLEYGVVDDQILIGVNDGIDTYLEGPSSPLSESDSFTQTMAELPDEYSNIAFVNAPEVVALYSEYMALFSTSASSQGIVDADPACAEYDSQEEAQAAYDEDDVENFALDQDYDGDACEDFFNPSTPEATPADIAAEINVLGMATVSSQSEDGATTNSIIRIGD